jgi:hypothetical protein
LSIKPTEGSPAQDLVRGPTYTKRHC